MPVFNDMPEDHPLFPHRCPGCELRDGACLHNISERFARGDKRFNYSSLGMRELPPWLQTINPPRSSKKVRERS